MTVEEMFSMAEGKSLTSLVVKGFGSWIVAVTGSAALGFQQAVNFMFLPFVLLYDIAYESVNSFILSPMGITDPAWAITAEELVALDILAGPAGTVMALVGLYIVLRYVALPITSNVLPGMMADNVIFKWLFTTAEEEEEGET